MGISIKTRKMLWGRAANRCNFPDCKRELVMDSTETDDESIIGEECHIVAREEDGPRGFSNLTAEQRDKYGNLLILCNVHHKLIDNQPNTYTIEKLSEIKNNHEEWVKKSLDFDEKKQRDDEIYTTYIEEWCQRIDIDNWQNWVSYLICSGQPEIYIEKNDEIEELKEWLLSRVWPNRYAEVEYAFENFRMVLEDLYKTFHLHSKEVGNVYRTEKFYNIDRWNPELYNSLSNNFSFHVALVEDLTLELTRAVNYICDKIRYYIMPSFRIKEGKCLVTYGPLWDLSFRTIHVEYKHEERTNIPYPGITRFKEIRENRDKHFGEGANSKDPKFLKILNTEPNFK